MKAKISEIEVRSGLTLKVGERVYWNFNKGRGSFGVMQGTISNIFYEDGRKIDLINAFEEDIDIEIVSDSGRFSTYNISQLRNCIFKTYAEASAY